jgi:hypothetical protein
MSAVNDAIGRKLLAIARAELADTDYALRLRNEDIARLNARRAVLIAQIQRLEGARTLDEIDRTTGENIHRPLRAEE